MNARELKSWLEKLTEEELDMDVFAGAPNADGEYRAVEKVAISGTEDGEKAIFMEPLPEENN